MKKRLIPSVFFLLPFFVLSITVQANSSVETTSKDVEIGRKIYKTIKEIEQYRHPRPLNYLNSISSESSFFPLKQYLIKLNNTLSIKNDSDFEKLCLNIEYSENNFTNYFNYRLFISCSYIFEQKISYFSNNKLPITKTYLDFIETNLYYVTKKNSFGILHSILFKIKNSSELKESIIPIIAKYLVNAPVEKDSKIIKLLDTQNDKSKYYSFIAQLKFYDQSKTYFIKSIKKIEKSIAKHKKYSSLPSPLFEEIDQLFSYYKKNIKAFNNNEFLKMISVIKSIQIRRYYKKSEIYLKDMMSFITGESYYEILFYLLWNTILEKDYADGLNIIKQYGLDQNYNDLNTRILFWMAYINLQNQKYNETINYLNAIITNAPLTFYAVMSQKILSQLPTTPEMTPKIKLTDFFIKEGPDNELDFQILGTLVHSYVKRYEIWKEIGLETLAILEQQYLISLKTEQFFNPSFIDNYVIKDNLSSLQVILTAKIQMEQGEYLKSFNYLGDAVSKKRISPNKTILKLLFPKDYEELIKKNAPPIDPAVILSIIRQESAFNPKAHSSAGARGLMQLMPRTAKKMMRRIKSKDLHNPTTNITLGIQFFKKLYRSYDGNLVYTLAAYNAGGGNLNKWIDGVFTQNSTLYTIEAIPFKETRHYVQLIFRNIYFYKYLNETQEDSKNTNTIFDINLGLTEILKNNGV